MKKHLFFFAMLMSVAASAQVTHVEPVSANYANKTVSFRVWWNAGSRDATHLSKIWAWVDYIKVNADNTTSGNTWTRAAVSAASPTASVSYDDSNRQGFWLQGNSGSYSATVTVQLNITETKFNWCAYVSDYPPNVTLDKGTYTFKGTVNFIVSSHAQPVTTKTVTRTSLTINSSSTFTDATSCPGIGNLYCPYTGSDLYMDVTHLCQQRTSGAKNWEAWIKDTRDNEYYRIVLMPDNNWWLAQNLKYAGAGYPAVGCTPDECGRAYPPADVRNGSTGANIQGLCPSGWLLPVNNNWTTLRNNIGNNQAALAALRVPTSPCGGATNVYGFADIHGVCFTTVPIGATCDGCSQWYSWTGSEDGTFWFDCSSCPTNCSGAFYFHVATSRYNRVRCLRQL
ncbi:MAG: hypothetical protein LBF81_00665 [Prevotellaceae bacterium]|jgi:uncharacterized protein (TIGR02145 family)|nr:hypothetical protein [Prevotellaceae bacterium]